MMWQAGYRTVWDTTQVTLNASARSMKRNPSKREFYHCLLHEIPAMLNRSGIMRKVLNFIAGCLLSLFALWCLVAVVETVWFLPKVLKQSSYDHLFVNAKEKTVVIYNYNHDSKKSYRHFLSKEEMADKHMQRFYYLALKAEGEGGFLFDAIVANARRACRKNFGSCNGPLRGGSSVFQSVAGSKMGYRTEMNPFLLPGEWGIAVLMRWSGQPERLIFSELCAYKGYVSCSITSYALFGRLPHSDREHLTLIATAYSSDPVLMAKKASDLCLSFKKKREVRLQVKNCSFNINDFEPKFAIVNLSSKVRLDGLLDVSPNAVVPLLKKMEDVPTTQGEIEISVADEEGKILFVASNSAYIKDHAEKNKQSLGSVAKVAGLLCVQHIPPSDLEYGKSDNQGVERILAKHANKACLEQFWGSPKPYDFGYGQINSTSAEFLKKITPLLSNPDANVQSALRAAVSQSYGTLHYIKPMADKRQIRIRHAKSGTVSRNKAATKQMPKGQYGGLIYLAVEKHGKTLLVLIRMHNNSAPICRQNGCMKRFLKPLAEETLELLAIAIDNSSNKHR